MKRALANWLSHEAQRVRRAAWLIAIMVLTQVSGLHGQQILPWPQTGEALRGHVVDTHGDAVSDAMVSLLRSGGGTDARTKTDRQGSFSFQVFADASYRVIAEKADRRSIVSPFPKQGGITLVLGSNEKAASPDAAMEFSDQQHFSVAGVTDWTAAGGHGSDTILRTSESLTNATAALRAEASPKKSGTASDLTKSSSADAYRLAGRRDEKLGKPLLAVQEFEQAANLDPSEENEFEWASELLLHRAISEAEQVFQKGAHSFPSSQRMQAGYGAALFAGSRYNEAAQYMCRASDLDPSATSPYVFLGEIVIAAPNSLDCVISRLRRFVEMHAESATANYLYAMALLKDRSEEAGPPPSRSAKDYLNKAASLDPTCGEAYLQLGVLAAAQDDFQSAIRFYLQTIKANPKLADAHYRLGVAYDRIGERSNAQQEFALHEQMKQQQAESVEEQRKAIKQFLFTKPNGLQVVPPK